MKMFKVYIMSFDEFYDHIEEFSLLDKADSMNEALGIVMDDILNFVGEDVAQISSNEMTIILTLKNKKRRCYLISGEQE